MWGGREDACGKSTHKQASGINEAEGSLSNATLHLMARGWTI